MHQRFNLGLLHELHRTIRPWRDRERVRLRVTVPFKKWMSVSV